MSTIDLGLIGTYSIVVKVNNIDSKSVNLTPLEISLTISDPCTSTEFEPANLPEILSVPQGNTTIALTKEKPFETISRNFGNGANICGPKTATLLNPEDLTALADLERVFINQDASTFEVILVSSLEGTLVQ